jgi:hypothetical protein
MKWFKKLVTPCRGQGWKIIASFTVSVYCSSEIYLQFPGGLCAFFHSVRQQTAAAEIFEFKTTFKMSAVTIHQSSKFHLFYYVKYAHFFLVVFNNHSAATDVTGMLL